jgi:ferredoxin
LQVVDSKARLVKESYCDGLGACLKECPQEAITLEEREAEVFDEEEVRVNLEDKRELTNSMPCGCPSTIAQSWETKRDKATIKAPSLLSHWPVKLTLVSPSAPYFRGEELVVAADCGPFAYGGFHQDFLDERAVVIGCPKFDDLKFYQEKLTDKENNRSPNGGSLLFRMVDCSSECSLFFRKGNIDRGKSNRYSRRTHLFGRRQIE